MEWIVALMVLVILAGSYFVFVAIVKWILSDGPSNARLFGVTPAKGSEDQHPN